jgi:cell wall-associated NlpC family hydrolase
MARERRTLAAGSDSDPDRDRAAENLERRGAAGSIAPMSFRRVLLLALAVAAAGCAGGSRAAHGKTLPPPAAERRAGTRERGAGPAPGSPRRARRVPRELAVRRAVDTASGLVGSRDIVVGGVSFGDGCAALVRAAFAEAGAPLPEGAEPADLLSLARSRGGTRRSRPAAGDLVFLADRPGGPAEHVGIVVSVSPEGTAVFVHHTERGVARLRVTPSQPWKARTEAGKVLNDVLLVGAGRVTAGRLLVGYATLL